jgi:hypothetical protein
VSDHLVASFIYYSIRVYLFVGLRKLPFPCVSGLSGGNQREQDRLKAQKKAAQQAKPKQSGSSLAKKKEA